MPKYKEKTLNEYVDPEEEYKKSGKLLLGVILVFIIMALFMWWMKKSLR